MKREDIEYLLIDYEIENIKFRKLFEFVVQKIPDSYEEEFPCFSVWKGTGGVGEVAYVDGPNIYFNVDSLLKKPKDVTIGTIAHELAHICLRHYGTGGLENEERADGLACQWGFRKEIKAMREKTGPPTDEQKP